MLRKKGKKNNPKRKFFVLFLITLDRKEKENFSEAHTKKEKMKQMEKNK